MCLKMVTLENQICGWFEKVYMEDMNLNWGKSQTYKSIH